VIISGNLSISVARGVLNWRQCSRLIVGPRFTTSVQCISLVWHAAFDSYTRFSIVDYGGMLISFGGFFFFFFFDPAVTVTK
jgi:hypothetical protein